MRFLESGADIPEELIRAVTSGSVTFLCGAGVSFRSGLPTFKQLTLDIYKELGESPDDEPAERNAIPAVQANPPASRLHPSFQRRAVSAS